MASSAQNERNRTTWSKTSAQRDLEGGSGFTDKGERAALDRIREQVRGKPILDLGVGTGRTIPLLEPLTSDYSAVDYVPAMVLACRKNFPTARIDVGDARDLGRYRASHYGLVYFSFNGIDAVSAADRRLVFRAVRRVLAPGGIFAFSTLNLDGPSYRERPWKIRVWPTKNPVRIAWSVAKQVAGAPLDLIHWLNIRHEGERGPGYAVAPLSAHHYGVLAHYTTMARQVAELHEEGFESAGPIFESRDGERVSPGDDTSHSDWFHFIVRRTEPASVSEADRASQ